MEKTQAKAMALGEEIQFDRILKTYVDTKYGAQVVLKFTKNGKIVRSLFAGKGILDFIQANPDKKSIKLVDKVSEGEFTYNIYE